MKNKYKHTNTIVSLLNYHIVFCPRYRRKIFNIEGLEEKFKQLTLEECKKHNIEVLALECNVDHVHIFVSVYPQQSIPKVVQQIKGATSKKLREEFQQLSPMPNLWTRSYFVSTAGNVSSETIEWYINQQKKRG